MLALRRAFRSLARHPFLSALVVSTLGLGIGASAALFAYLASIVAPRIGAPAPERLVQVYAGTVEAPRNSATHPDFLHLVSDQAAVTALTGFAPISASVGIGEETHFVWAQQVSGRFFSVYGAHPEAGRLLTPADDRPGAEPVAVVSDLFWKRHLGGDFAAVGRQIRVNGLGFTVVGVVPSGFQGQGLAAPLYIPLAQADRLSGTPRLDRPEARWLQILGRLAPGVSLAQAQAALDGLAHALDTDSPEPDARRRFSLVPATAFDPEVEATGFASAARILLAAALLFLLLGAANVANILVARAVERQRAQAVRFALGAGRRHVLGEILAESLLLALAGGIVGAGVAEVLMRRIEMWAAATPSGFGSFGDGSRSLTLDARVLGFALAAAAACALLCALAPALRVLRPDLLPLLQSQGRGAGAPRGTLVLRQVLVIAQVAASVLLLLGGGLLVRSLRQALDVDPGLTRDHLLMVTYFVPRIARPEEGSGPSLDERVRAAAGTLPGVMAASVAAIPPFAGWSRSLPASPQGQDDAPRDVAYNIVAPGYFATSGIPILRGRPLDERDRKEAAPAVVVSQGLARQLWGAADPLGRLLVSAPPRAEDAGPVFTVVGVARDIRTSPVDQPLPLLYFSSAQRRSGRMTLLVRSTAPPAALLPPLRTALHTVHPELSMMDVATLREQVDRSLALPHLYAEVAGLFGGLGLAVAVSGLFGLLSYAVSLRRREIGIRLALGARPGDVVGLLVRQGMTLAAVGVGLGLAGAVPLARLLASLLFGIQPLDAATFVAVPLGLALVAFAASYLPARRASRVSPLDALREE